MPDPNAVQGAEPEKTSTPEGTNPTVEKKEGEEKLVPYATVVEVRSKVTELKKSVAERDQKIADLEKKVATINLSQDEKSEAEKIEAEKELLRLRDLEKEHNSMIERANESFESLVDEKVPEEDREWVKDLLKDKNPLDRPTLLEKILGKTKTTTPDINRQPASGGSSEQGQHRSTSEIETEKKKAMSEGNTKKVLELDIELQKARKANTQ